MLGQQEVSRIPEPTGSGGGRKLTLVFSRGGGGGGGGVWGGWEAKKMGRVRTKKGGNVLFIGEYKKNKK